MAKRAIIPANIPATFAELLQAVKVTMVEGQQAVEQVMALCSSYQRQPGNF